MIRLLLNGFAIGVAVAAPVGPIGLLCIRRSIADGKLVGFLTGLGAAVADALMALLAALGVTAISAFIAKEQRLFTLCGGILLLGMGIHSMLAKAKTRATNAPLHARSVWTAFLSTIPLTLANPVTIGGMLLLFSSFGIAVGTSQHIEALFLVSGVFLGSAFWWLVLSFFAHWFGHRLNTRLLKTINVVTGGIISLIGVWQLLSLFLSRQ